MKQKRMKRIFAGGSVLTAALLLAALLPACAALNSKELTRERARRLIAADKSFTQPYSIRLEGSEKYLVPAESAGEEPPDARAAEEFYRDYPLTAALHHLGLVEVKATAVKRPQTSPYVRHVTAWEYKIESRLTDKGREWAEGTKDGLPLYRREVTEVTGVTAGQEGRASAEFKWRRVPTRVGEALEAEGPTFKSLPAEIQQNLKRSISKFGNALPVSYQPVQNGHAELRLFDDGWRLERVQL